MSLRRLRQRKHKFKASLGHVVSSLDFIVRAKHKSENEEIEQVKILNRNHSM